MRTRTSMVMSGYRRTAKSGRLSVYRGERLRKFFALSQGRRVDWVDLGDSNEVFGGTGRNHGIQFALQSLGLPLYSVGLFSGNENLGPGSSLGYFCGASNNGGRPNDNAACPVELSQYNPFTVTGTTLGQFHSHYAWFMNDAQTDASNQGIFISKSASSPFNTDLAWRFRFRYGTIPAGIGSGLFRPTIRLDGSPFTTLAQSAAVITTGSAPSYALATETLSVAAGSRAVGLQGRWVTSGNIEGPVYLLWITADCVPTTAGVAYHTMVARGGQGLVEYNKAIGESAVANTEFISFAAAGQNADPVMLFCINSGFNDRNDAADPSLGPIGGIPSDEPAGFADNMRGLIDKIETAWAAAGYNRSNLYFLLQPSHPLSIPDDADVVSYRAACRPIADEVENTAVQDLAYPGFAYPLEANAAAWYAAGGADRLHMQTAGYEQFSRLWVKDLITSL